MAKEDFGPASNAGGFEEFASPLNAQVKSGDPRGDYKIGKFPAFDPSDPLGIVPGKE